MIRRRTHSSRRRALYEYRRREDIILRDILALDRTVLANERTLMAYVRTSLALLVGGVTLVHFFDIVSARILGYAMISFTPLMLGYGIWRFAVIREHLSRAGNGHDKAQEHGSSTAEP